MTGVIRIGGNSGDATFWTSTGETPPSWSAGTVTSGITLGGHPVSPGGFFPQPRYTPAPVFGRTAEVTVNAGSAVILKFSGLPQLH